MGGRLHQHTAKVPMFPRNSNCFWHYFLISLTCYIDMCRVWQAWVHMNHLVKGSICHILAQDPKVADFVLCLKRHLL